METARHALRETPIIEQGLLKCAVLRAMSWAPLLADLRVLEATGILLPAISCALAAL